MAGRKRKASELEDAPVKQKKGKKRASKTEEADNSVPFKAFAASDPQAQEGAYQNTVTLMDGLSVKYAVKPDTWGQIKQYTNVKLQTETFSKGDIIYVCNKDPPPEPPPTSLADGEYLEYERQNFWVGKIVESRATDDRNVFLLVAWLYWPHEIPQHLPGAKEARQYYGQGELVLSNYLDVIDAMTISNKAEITWYNEKDDNQLGNPSARYWRQSFDARTCATDKKAKNLLSKLRTLCKCDKPHNPDQKLWHCPNKGCGNWNHNECLLDDIGKRAWKNWTEGKMDDFAEQNKLESRSFANQLLSPAKKVRHFVTGAIEEVFEEGLEAIQHETTIELHSSVKAASGTNGTASSHKRKQGRPRKAGTGWESDLDISIVSEENTQLFARIKEKSGNKKWDVRVNCLCCGKLMD
ncbi:hypothetical protein OHC33_007961 [Knufia fluminis]|uniref:BAH domain-containing protein n=1 Tax=Knufia fluminis TaxID=191047 RepID=A0AAN8ECH1_9EURO|nr:hypothetical protein OHC33_007961 [Knufia fluminis]